MQDIEFSEQNPLRVLICGGGNAPHLFMGLLGSRKDVELRVLAFHHDEADRLNHGIQTHGGIKLVTSDKHLIGRPHKVSKHAEEVTPGSQLILISLPAFAHEGVLQMLSPHLDAGVIIGALPAQSGFEFMAKHILGDKLHSTVIFGTQTLPWACRIKQYGVEVHMQGRKSFVFSSARPTTATSAVCNLMTNLCSPVTFRPGNNFLNITLAPTNQLIHPAVMYSLFHNWDGTPLDTPPLFYQSLNDFAAEKAQKMSDEFQALKTALEKQGNGSMDLSGIVPIFDFIRASYPDDIRDPSTLKSCFNSNKAYEGMAAPMKMAGGYHPRVGFEPDFDHRYLTEDIPFGLAVTRGIAELVGVDMPTTDEVLLWCQSVMGKEFLKDGKMCGANVGECRVPQRYGITTVQELVAFDTA